MFRKKFSQILTYNLCTTASPPFAVVVPIARFAGSDIDNIMPTVSYKSRHDPNSIRKGTKELNCYVTVIRREAEPCDIPDKHSPHPHGVTAGWDHSG